MGLNKMDARNNNLLRIIHQKYSEPPDELCTTFCKLDCKFMLALQEAFNNGAEVVLKEMERLYARTETKSKNSENC